MPGHPATALRAAVARTLPALGVLVLLLVASPRTLPAAPEGVNSGPYEDLKLKKP